MFTLKKGLAVLLITLIGVYSANAEESDWTFWQEKFFQMNAENATDHETAHYWRTQEPHIKEARVTATLPDYPWVKVSGYRNRPVERCITCHDGISAVSSSHPADFGCTVCHGGEPESVDKNQAHATLIYDPLAGTGKRNPSSLSVVEKSCGQLYCHSGHVQEDRNHIQRLNKSMMNTMAGMISGLRYQWAGQSEKTARYGKQAVSDNDGNIPVQWGALDKLDKLPYFSPLDTPEWDKNTIQPISKHPADRLLRQKCFQCHIDSPPPPGQFRSQGCAACHFTYSKTGLYEGNDPTISKTQPGHAKFHKIQALPQRQVCVQCHKGFSIQKLGNEPSPVKPDLKEKKLMLESDEQLEDENFSLPDENKVAQANEVDEQPIDKETLPDPEESEELLAEKTPDEENLDETVDEKQDKKEEPSLFSGEGMAKADVHTARGMDCIDCHTQRDIMGDGNIYSKQHQAVEIRCETCHGNDSAFPMISQIKNPKDTVIRLSKHYKGEPNAVGDWVAVSERKNLLSNVKVQNGKLVLIGKQSGRTYDIPLLKGKGVHSIPQHRSRLECSACHSQWVVKCKGCHASMKLGKVEWESSEMAAIKTQKPSLMIGPRGKVTPMLAQPERHLSVLDEKGKPIPALGTAGAYRGNYQEWQYTNPHSSSGSNLAYSLNPHSTGTHVRSCESCHLSPETLGLGKGDLKIGANNSGKNDSLVPINRTDKKIRASVFDPQAKVSMRGEILAGSSQQNARPFNQKEIIRILRVGNCIPCHEDYDDPIYQDIKKSYTFESTLEHRQLRQEILNSRQNHP
ncbi:MAG: hypothetical protein VW455_05800 [Nitrospinota bacterium]